MKFYLISFDKQGKSKELCFWRSFGRGYTNTVTEAGEFTALEIVRAGYHNGPNCVALPKNCLPLLTKALKASWEEGPEPRLLVHVIPTPEAKELILDQLVMDRVLLGFNPIAQTWRTKLMTQLAEQSENA